MVIYENKIKIYINNKYHPKLTRYHILFHSLKNTYVQFKNKIYRINKIYKIWNWGWYYCMEVTDDKCCFEIAYLNKSSCIPYIQKMIEINCQDLIFLNNLK